ncbi:MAG: LysR family transcriptional regulator [Loktanella sp.]|nr:LysR family transcriptional regulator [Loktanella sp.]
MDRSDLVDLQAFAAVAEEGSFTRAAARLGRAQSGVSQAVSGLEERLGSALFRRSTRSVRLTESGQRLLDVVAPALLAIDAELSGIRQGRAEVAGHVRLTVMAHPARAIVLPALREFLDKYPAVTVDLDVSDRLTDIVAGGFDAGIRFGRHLEQDMVAVPLGPDISTVIVASLDYFARHGVPEDPADLSRHACLNYRTASHGDLYRWGLRRGTKSLDVDVSGPVITNDGATLIDAAREGIGLAMVIEPLVRDDLAAGRLIACLAPFCPTWAGYHIYYPSRRQKSAALTALVDHLRGFVQRGD